MNAPRALIAAAALPFLLSAPALATEPVAAPELEAQMVELREALEARDADVEELRAELEALKSQTREPVPAPTTDAERVGYGEAVQVHAGERVPEVVAFGDDVHVAGHVVGDATSFGGSILVASTGVVGGDAVSFGGTVEVEDGGVIEGDRVALGVPGVAPAAAPDAALGAISEVAAGGESWFDTLYRRLILLLSFAGAGVLVVGLFPNRVGRIARDLEQRPIRSAAVGVLGSGFLVLFAVLFAILTLGLGLPVSMVVVVVLGLAWLLGFVGLCQAVGDRLPFDQRPRGRWVAFLVGTVLLTFFGSLPLVGWLVVFAASAVGIGSALATRFGSR